MSWGKFLLWSTVLSLPTLFFIPKKKPGFVAPGPTTDDGEGGEIVTEPSAPPEPFDPDPGAAGVNTIPAEFKNFQPPPLPGYTRMTSASVPVAVMPKLRPLLAAPLGTVTKLPTDGRDIAAVIEPHFHEPGGPVKPWGWHKGVSLYERKGAVA